MLEAQKCLGCGDRLEMRQVGELATCLSCGSSYVKLKETIEEVADHRFLPCKISESQARSNSNAKGEAELVYLPFWVIRGELGTTFIASTYKESFFALRKKAQKGSVTDEPAIFVPACRTELALGQSLPIALDEEFDGCYTLTEGETQPFDVSALQNGHWFSGSKSQKRAVTEAVRHLNTLHRIAVEQRHQEQDIHFEHSENIKKTYLMHRPFWVFRNSEETVAVDAHSGAVLKQHIEEKVSYGASFRAGRIYTLGRFALGLGGAFACLLPAFWAGFLDEERKFFVLLMSSLALLFFTRVFMFAIYSPYKILSAQPRARIAGVFIPRLRHHAFDDPDSMFWSTVLFFYLPLVALPLLFLKLGVVTSDMSLLGMAAAVGLIMEVSAILPFVPLIAACCFVCLAVFMFLKGVWRHVLRLDEPNSTRFLGLYSFGELFVVLMRMFLTFLIALPMLGFPIILGAEVFLLPGLKTIVSWFF